MPYIKIEERKDFDSLIEILEQTITTPGQLNYVISSLCWGLIAQWGESYQKYNDLVGVLECAKLELYRRRISKYENLKADENGDL